MKRVSIEIYRQGNAFFGAGALQETTKPALLSWNSKSGVTGGLLRNKWLHG